MTRFASFLLLIALAPSAARAEYLTGVTAVASSEQVKGLFGAANLVNNNGLTETPAGSGKFALTNNAYADGGSAWHSAYLPTGPQEHPLVQFDFGKVATIGGFHIWNHNANPGRGLRNVAVYASDDGKTWRTVPQRLTLAKAPGKPGYLGEAYPLNTPLTTRYVRFWGESTHRAGGQADVAGLGKVRFLIAAPAAKPAEVPTEAFPFDTGVVNVKQPPYSAKGDGKTDDTEALQKAIHETQATHRLLYLPAGTYLVSATLAWKPGVGHGRLYVTGAGRDKSVIRLKNDTFTDAKSPRPVLFNGYHGREAKRVSADWFHNHFTDFSIDIGTGNAGAIGLQFYSNNLGLLKNVAIRSGDGAGVTGLDLAPADLNGPLLVKNVSVSGFATGVRSAGTVNSQTIDGLTLEGQKKVGLRNEGQCLTVRGLKSKNAVAAVESTFGMLTLDGAELTAVGNVDVAVSSRELLYARDIRAVGYQHAIRHTGKDCVASPDGPKVEEYASHKPIAVGGKTGSLRLPVKEAPEAPVDNIADWANVRHFRTISDRDDTAAFQRALDSGAATVYLPPGGGYVITGPIEVRGKVQRILGMFANVRGVRLNDKPAPVLRLAAGTAQTVYVENLFSGMPLENPSGRTLVVRNCEISGGRADDRGELFLENVGGTWTFGKGQTVWARQLNVENEGTHLTNAGSKLWLLGIKTERGGILIDTQTGGETEVVGGLCYTTTKGKLGPMFRVTDGKLSVTLGEVCYTGDPYRTLIEATLGGKMTTLQRGEAPLRPAFLQGSALPLVTVGR